MGERVLFYPEAEEILAKTPRRGIPMCCGSTAMEPVRLGTACALTRWFVRFGGVRPTFYVHLGRLPTWRAELEEAGLTDG